MTKFFTRIADGRDDIFREILRGTGADQKLRVASPLGLGKPNLLLNAIYAEAKTRPEVPLTIYTALSLLPPRPGDAIAERFIGRFRDRHWGKDYPELQYALDGNAAKLPPNISVHEFYFQAGAAMRSDALQQAYQSINYTHVVASLLEAKVNVLVQMIAKRTDEKGTRYSLSCNPDLTLDLVDAYRQSGVKLYVVGAVHPDLPFLDGEAAVDASFFSSVVEDPTNRHELFALPRTPIGPEDHLIGFHASQLIADGGTIQVGIGSLSDAVVHSLLLRQQAPSFYEELVKEALGFREISRGLKLEKGIFTEGLYGLSEMITDGFMHLRRAGILKRFVRDEATGMNTYLHGAFYLGSKEFYEWLRTLEGKDQIGLRMSRISKINDLYDPNEILLRKQRVKARFLNTCMQVTLLGGAASETLENGRVVSGVGGQYNFVSMSHELDGALSILMLRSTRVSGGKRSSNLVWGHRNLTIPRHLRDIVITEYGTANIRNRSDEETIIELLNITDSEFQQELLKTAKHAGKVRKDYQIPLWAKENTPQRIREITAKGRSEEAFTPFPFGSDFTPVEETLALALGKISGWKESRTPFQFALFTLGRVFHSFSLSSEPFKAEFERMGLSHPKTLTDSVMKRLLLCALLEEHEKESDAP